MGTITLDCVTFDISPDEMADSPRSWDNLGTMVCWHRRYQLGDKHTYATPQAFSRRFRRTRSSPCRSICLTIPV